MLNGDLKEEALNALKEEEKRREEVSKVVIKVSEELYQKRQDIAKTVIPTIEDYINSIANSPKEFSDAVTRLKISYNKFREEIRIAEKAYEEAKIVAKGTGAGVAAGVGVAAFAPTAAMAIATTFGTASTGAAISALSGAAATNAALAWLGGGALVAGGGGMAGGNALLALAGPVGWAIGAASLVGGGYIMRHKNEKFAREANKAKAKVSQEIKLLQTSLGEIKKMNSEITKHSDGIITQLNLIKKSVVAKSSSEPIYISKDEKKQLMALVNNVNTLSVLLVKNIQR